MKSSNLSFSGKSAWQNNKPFIWFLSGLLLLHSILKIIFYHYNQPLFFDSPGSHLSFIEIRKLIKWSLASDMLTLLGINSFFLFALTLVQFMAKEFSAWLNMILGWLVVPFFALVNSLALILNLGDIFYYPFHFQRANAGLLYVLDHPFNRLQQQSFFIILLFFTVFAVIILLMLRMHVTFFSRFTRGDNCKISAALLFLALAFSLVFKDAFSRFLVPTYPMIELQGKQVPFVQNSFHTFIYSYFRKGEPGLHNRYMTDVEADSVVRVRKKLNTTDIRPGKKNMVLFIMESVPYEFFDPNSGYKVNMPFFDSILQKSTFFNNAYCYAHESNKGITAILTGIPTLSDIPLYHSPYVNMPFTPVGTALKKLQYRSFFCIGDEHDNFGFAKCMTWLGIDTYYSKEDIQGYKDLPAHSMGLQDSAVLDFFGKKIKQQPQPFLAIQYNISTHYPYDIPESSAKRSPKDYTAPMKAMQYYDDCLRRFFNHAKNEAWFSNTQFIFCSDHWLFPQGKRGTYNAVSSYHIPVILYDPAKPEMKTINRLISQFDIHAAILKTAGYPDSVTSFGNGLTDSLAGNHYVFSKQGNSIYQVMDSNYVLGFNTINNKVEYLYDYKKDRLLSHNMAAGKHTAYPAALLLKMVKAFVQKTTLLYNHHTVK